MPPFKTATLPTLDLLSVDPEFLGNFDAVSVARAWFREFTKAVLAASAADTVSLFAPVSPFWRDILCLSWDLRTIQGTEGIQTFLGKHLLSAGFALLHLSEGSIQLQRLTPDLAWIFGSFTFETTVGICYGAFRLVPYASEGSSPVWKAYTLFTNLESLKGFPERIGSLREQQMLRGSWAEKRQQEINFSDEACPAVLIVGAGQTGLQIAARLKVLGVRALVVERHGRVGDQWRERYDALSLHSPLWVDYMAYMPYPVTWPVFPPGAKFADWLESYAAVMELDVWTSTTVTKASQDPESGKWVVRMEGANGAQRTLSVNHLVFAHGSNGGPPHIPDFEGLATFSGTLIHSSKYKNPTTFLGKKVVVVGSCTSAHEICADLARSGVDVTMYQRSPTYVMSSTNGLPLALTAYSESGPPVEDADRITASFPWWLTLELSKGLTAAIKALDSEMLDAINTRGFKTYDGIEGTGFIGLMYTRSGGYYPDTGSCQLIIDGKIKIKSDTNIKKIIREGFEFEDGTKLHADAIICATGYGDVKTSIGVICGEDVTSKLKPTLGFDDEGEIPGLCRPSGVQNLWVHMGTLAMGRQYSKYLALQIKAVEAGLV